MSHIISSSPPSFGYPRALYDPEYVPPKLLHRTKELNTLLHLFQSCIVPSDYYTINTYIYGMHGIGKSVFSKYFIKLLKSKEGTQFNHIYLNLATKSSFENLRLLVELYSQFHSNKFTYFENSQQLWSYFQFLRNKSDIPLILLLDNMNPANQSLIEKFIRYSKDLNLSTIVTSELSFENYIKDSALIKNSIDFPLKLDTYSSSALLDIISQRITLAFPTSLDAGLAQYIIDIVTHFDHYRPGTCINILKSIYQQKLNGFDITPTFIRDNSIHLLEFPFQDDLDYLLQLDDSKLDLIYFPLLEKLAIFFKNEQNIYIHHEELFRLYKIACDELMQPYNHRQFENLFEQLIFDGFLYSSNCNSSMSKPLYFTVINPERILEYLEIKFSNYTKA